MFLTLKKSLNYKKILEYTLQNQDDMLIIIKHVL